MIMPVPGGLPECQKRCDMKKECTAIEYSNLTNHFPHKENYKMQCCILRKCPLPVPVPQVLQAKWHRGEFKYVGYVERK